MGWRADPIAGSDTREILGDIEFRDAENVHAPGSGNARKKGEGGEGNTKKKKIPPEDKRYTKQCNNVAVADRDYVAECQT